jgi:hypothetical protein
MSVWGGKAKLQALQNSLLQTRFTSGSKTNYAHCWTSHDLSSSDSGDETHFEIRKKIN